MNILRPTKLVDFIGNEKIKSCLEIAIHAAKVRDKPLGHILNQGRYGCGKTTLANMIADAMGGNFFSLNAASITKKQHLLELFCKIKKNDVIFIDEIHRLDISLEEFMYPAMEDFTISLPKPSARFGEKESFTNINIAPFTLIGATTDSGALSGPFKSRFKTEYYLDPYTPHDLTKIGRANAPKLELNITDDALMEVAKRSKMTPRLLNARLEWVNDYRITKDIKIVQKEDVSTALDMIGIDAEGLDQNDRKYLAALSKGGYKPVGMKTLVSMTSLSEETITKYIEPHLIEIGKILISKSGRELITSEEDIERGKRVAETIDNFDDDLNEV